MKTLFFLLACTAVLGGGCAKYSVTLTDPDSGVTKELKVFSWRKFPQGAQIYYGSEGFQFGTPEVSAPDVDSAALLNAILRGTTVVVEDEE